MASLRTLPNSPYWIACITSHDSTRTQRSTRVPVGGVNQSDLPRLEKFLAEVLGAKVSMPAGTDKHAHLGARDARRLAQLVADKFEETARQARQGRLVESQARKTIADIYMAATADSLPTATVDAFFKGWLRRKELECSESTFVRYEGVVTRYLKFLGSRAKLNLTSVTSKDVVAFRDDLAKQVASGTANLYLKSLRVAFGQAVKDGLIDTNPAARVSILKQNDRNEKRPFTLPELKRLLELADNTWRGVILAALYTGQRLSDVANLTWANVDLQRQELRLVTKKTSRRLILPLAAPLLRHLEALPAGDEPDEPIFPLLFGRPVSTLSNAFSRLMALAGLAKVSEHRSKDKGRGVRRERNEVSFHTLRHSTTSLLKIAGVSEAVAMAFVGHDSPAVSAQYTHVDTDTLRRAVKVLPDITKGKL